MFQKRVNGVLSRNYYVDFWVGERGPGGLHVNKSTGTSDRAEAAEIEAKWRAEAEEKLQGLALGYSSPDDVLLSDALDWVAREKWANNKDGQRQIHQVQECIGLIGDLPLSSFSGNAGKVTVYDLRSKLLGSKSATHANGRERGKPTVDRYMAAMRTLLLTTRREFPGMANLTVPDVPMYNAEQGHTRVLTAAEETLLFDGGLNVHGQKISGLSGSDPDFADLFRVLLDTGLRLGEALALDYRANVHLADRYVVVLQKSSKSNRQRAVPLTGRAYDILKRREKDCFPIPFPWSASRADRVFRRQRVLMGFLSDKAFSPHMLRHTCATRLSSRGFSGPQVQTWLGHSNPATTARYVHMHCEHLRAGVALLEQPVSAISVGADNLAQVSGKLSVQPPKTTSNFGPEVKQVPAWMEMPDGKHVNI